MNNQRLYDIAETEIRLNAYDQSIMGEALAQSGGILSKAHEAYWRLRALSIEEDAKKHPNLTEEEYLCELEAALARSGKRNKTREGVASWISASICIFAFGLSGTFFWAAWAEYQTSDRTISTYGIFGVVFSIIAVYSFIRYKQISGRDIFDQ